MITLFTCFALKLHTKNKKNNAQKKNYNKTLNQQAQETTSLSLRKF